jgi:RND family efflux transporter MFP subunit
MRFGRCGLLVVAGLGSTLLVSCGKADRANASRKAEAAERPVHVARAQVRAVPRVIHATGSLAAQEQSTLSAKVAGRLVTLNVDIGSELKQGDLVAQIEPRDYELGLQQATAALAQARTTLGLPLEGNDDSIELTKVTAVKQARAVLDEAGKNRERVKSLSGSGIASQSEVDTVEATYTVALARYEATLEDARSRMATVAQRRAEVELAQKRLADASVRAPFDGAVQTRPASVGEYVATGAPIVQLVKSNPLRLRLEVPERECLLVRTGQVVQLLIEGDTNTYCGQIARLSPALDEQTRTLRVEADVPRQGPLRAGLFARARVVVTEDEKALTIPPEALISFAGLEKVVTIQDGKAVEKVVATGRRGQNWAEVLSGLAAGDLVVLSPGSLRTGQHVSVKGETADHTVLQEASRPKASSSN